MAMANKNARSSSVQQAPSLDSDAARRTRWQRWQKANRFAMCRHEDLMCRIASICCALRKIPAELVEEATCKTCAPSRSPPKSGIKVRRVRLGPWDFQEVYSERSSTFARAYPFKPSEAENYLVHPPPPARTSPRSVSFSSPRPDYFCRQTAPDLSPRAEDGNRSSSRRHGYFIIDLDLSKYDKIAVPLRQRSSSRKHQSFLKERHRNPQRRPSIKLDRADRTRECDPKRCRHCC